MKNDPSKAKVVSLKTMSQFSRGEFYECSLHATGYIEKLPTIQYRLCYIFVLEMLQCDIKILNYDVVGGQT